MSAAKQFQYNERPSDFRNLGEDIPDAARHHRDTYETPEEMRRKAQAKTKSKDLKELHSQYALKLKDALAESTEAAIALIKEYELKRGILSCEYFQNVSEDINAIKSLVLSETDKTKREIMRKAFNRMINKIHKVRYIRPIKIASYFDPKTKQTFKEENGIKAPWSTNSKEYDAETLSKKIRALQFGNSLTENERIYCGENLLKAIQETEKHFEIDFKKLGFSFGARGKAGSIAHYQDSLKVLAFNRGWSGAFIHELGHAIDYSLNQVSGSMPYSIRRKYEERLRASQNPFVLAFISYLMDPKEMFARMFERHCIQFNMSPFTLTIKSELVLPELDAEALEWFESAIQSIKTERE